MDKHPEDQKDLEEKNMAGMDLISSIVLLLFSVVCVLLSSNMPRPGGWSSAPGLIPLLLSGTIFLMGVTLFILSLRNRGLRELVDKFSNFSLRGSLAEGNETKRSLWIIGLSGLYVFVLLDRLPFEIASFIYLASTIYVFWKKFGWLKIILLSLLLPLAISFIFRVLFIVFLPGDSVFDWILKYFK